MRLHGDQMETFGIEKTAIKAIAIIFILPKESRCPRKVIPEMFDLVGTFHHHNK